MWGGPVPKEGTIFGQNVCCRYWLIGKMSHKNALIIVKFQLWWFKDRATAYGGACAALWIKKLESDRCFPRQPSPSSRSSLSTSSSSLSFLKTLKLSLEVQFLSSPQHFVVMRAMHILLFYAYFSCPDIFPWRGHFGQNSITWVKEMRIWTMV